LLQLAIKFSIFFSLNFVFRKLYLVAEYGKFELLFRTSTGNPQFGYFFSAVKIFYMDTNKLFCYNQTVLYHESILPSLGSY